jgi:hypothetical protein
MNHKEFKEKILSENEIKAREKDYRWFYIK